MTPHQTLCIEVATVYEDVTHITEQAGVISAKAGVTGCPAMTTTLRVLKDQQTRLEERLADTEQHLQVTSDGDAMKVTKGSTRGHPTQ